MFYKIIMLKKMFFFFGMFVVVIVGVLGYGYKKIIDLVSYLFIVYVD